MRPPFSPLRKVYVRFKEDHPDSPNTFAAWTGFNEMGVETVPFYGFGDVEQLPDLGPEVGVVGFVGDVQTALKTIGVPKPEAIDYPEELANFMGRKIWCSTLGVIRRTVEPTFIKPVQGKLFTGFVWRGAGIEAVRIATCDDDTPVWCSEVFEFASEYRAYLRDGEILDVKHYKGDWSLAPSRQMVEYVISCYKSAPRGCSVDFGVTPMGLTFIVEANDGYALGNYGLNPALYAQLLAARWEELTRA